MVSERLRCRLGSRWLPTLQGGNGRDRHRAVQADPPSSQQPPCSTECTDALKGFSPDSVDLRGFELAHLEQSDLVLVDGGDRRRLWETLGTDLGASEVAEHVKWRYLQGHLLTIKFRMLFWCVLDSVWLRWLAASFPPLGEGSKLG